MLIDWLPLLLLGFSLGFMHALDADHVMAVSALANQKPSIKRTLLFSLQWALGHGGVLVACGVILFGIGVSIPSHLQHWAEMSVGVLLIFLGLSFFWTFRQQKIRLVQHRHDDIVHTHWSADDHESNNHLHSHKSNRSVKEAIIKNHQPVMIGMLHGMAGSAPALALIPAVTSGQLTLAMTYLVIFSLGVILSMVAFGLGFSWIQQYLYKNYQSVFAGCRCAIALAAIAFGSFWLMKTI